MIKVNTFKAIFMSDYLFDFCSFNCWATFWPPCILKLTVFTKLTTFCGGVKSQSTAVKVQFF